MHVRVELPRRQTGSGVCRPVERIQTHPADFSADEKRDLFHNAAARAYRLRPI